MYVNIIVKNVVLIFDSELKLMKKCLNHKQNHLQIFSFVYPKCF